MCFQDFATFNHPWKALLFLIGALGSLVGVVVLSKKETVGDSEDSGKRKGEVDEKEEGVELSLEKGVWHGGGGEGGGD